MQPAITLRLLGDLQIHAPGLPLLRYRKPAAGLLLAYLACHPGVHSREAAFHGVYGAARAADEVDAAKFRGLLATLRRDLAPWEEAAGPLVREETPARLLALSPHVVTDLAALLRRSEAARLVPYPAERAGALLGALGCHADRLLAGFEVGTASGRCGWVLERRATLVRRFIEDLEALVVAVETASGGEAAAAPLLDDLSVPAHIREGMEDAGEAGTRTCAALMRLALLAGRPGDALVWLARWGRGLPTAERNAALEREGGVPLRTLASAAEGIQRNRYRAAQDRALARRTIPLIGRESDLARLRSAVASLPRLVVLTGPPGVGKTRLAQALVENVAGDFAMAALATVEGVSQSDAVPTSVLATLGLRARMDPLAELRDALPDAPALIVLDGFEGLLTAGRGGREAVASLLATCPYLTLLVTSQRGFIPHGDWEVTRLRLAPLPDAPTDPGGLSDGAALLLACIRRRLPDFGVRPEDAPGLNELARRLDGLPLALRLAADWAHVHATPASLLAHLVRPEADAALASPVRALRDAVARSLSLRTEEERRLFARLGVFPDSWTEAALEAVCTDRPGEDSLPALAALVEGSLVETVADGRGVRYFLLPTLRRTAGAGLASGERTVLQRRHYEHFVVMAREADQGSPADLARLQAERENLRAAMEWALRQAAEPELALALAAALTGFWYRDGDYVRGRTWANAALHLARRTALSLELARLQHGAGILAAVQSDFLTAEGLMAAAREGFAALGDRQGTAAVLNSLQNLRYAQRRYAEGHACATEALALNEALAAEAPTLEERDARLRDVALNLNNRANSALALGRHDEAEADYARCLTLRRALRDEPGIVQILNNVANLDFHRGRYKQAREAWREACSRCRHLPGQSALDDILNNLGCALYMEDNYGEARAFLAECIEIRRRRGYRWGVLCTLANLAVVDALDDQPDAAWAGLAEGFPLARELDDRLTGLQLLKVAALLLAERGEAARAARLWGAVLSQGNVAAAPGVPGADLALLEAVLDPDASPGERARRQALARASVSRLGEDGFRSAITAGLTRAREDWAACIEDALD